MSLPALLGGTEDSGWSSPTFPTCFLDCRRIGRLCSSLTQSWCIKVRFQSPAAVRFRTRRETASFQNSSAAFLICSQFWQRCFLDLVYDILPSTLRDGVFAPHDLGLRTRCLFLHVLVSHRDQVLAMTFMWPGCPGASHAIPCETRGQTPLRFQSLSAGFVSGQFSHVAGEHPTGHLVWVNRKVPSFLLFPLLVWFLVLPGLWARCRRVLPFSRLSNLVFRRNALSISVFLLVFACRQLHGVSTLVRVWQISVRVRVRCWMGLVMELHTLRQCGVRASLVRVS